jgi:hypothetical protein
MAKGKSSAQQVVDKAKKLIGEYAKVGRQSALSASLPRRAAPN